MAARPYHLLIVADSPEDREACQCQIAQDPDRHYTLREAGSGEEGLRVCRSEPLDCVLLDHGLPDLDALEFLARLRTEQGEAAVPVVVLTAPGHEAMAAQALQEGAEDCLVKGEATGEALRRAVRAAIERGDRRRGTEPFRQEPERNAAMLLKAVAQLSLHAQGDTDRTALFDRAAALVARALSVEFVSILELLSDGRTLLLRTGAGWKEGSVGRATVDAGLDTQAGHALFSGQPVVADSLSASGPEIGEGLRAETRFREPALLREHGVVSGLSVIIYGPECPFGVLGAHSGERRPFTAEEAHFLQAVANGLAAAVRRWHAKESLGEAQQRLGLALEAAGMGVWEWDIATDRVSWSPSLEAVHGLPPGTFAGTYEAFLATVHPEDRPFVTRAVARVLEERIEHRIEYRAVMPDGSVRWMEGRGQLICDRAGRPLRMLGVGMDVTARKRAEEEARRHQDELVHVTRLGTLGEMAAGLAHEISQPLTAIGSYAQGCVERLRAGTASPPHLQDAMEKIAALAERAGKVVSHLGHLVRRRPPHRAPVNLNELIQGVIALTEPEIRISGVAVRLTLADPLPLVLADRVQAEQVLLNLVRNAIEAQSSAKPAERFLGIRTFCPDAETVQVSVSDRGVGLSAEVREKMFQPFFTTKLHGMGMGLVISRSILESHGGHLWAADNPDRGATFHFTLPPFKEGPDHASSTDGFHPG